jgi:hypothetical protein
MRALAARLSREGLAGAFVLASGVLLWVLAEGYPRGDLSEIGPGFMPWVASIGLIGLGAVMLAQAARAGHRDDAAAIGRAAAIVPAGMAIFAFGLEGLGLFATAAIGVFVTTFASRESTLPERVCIALVLATLVTLVFGYGLSMSLPLWPAWVRP